MDYPSLLKRYELKVTPQRLIILEKIDRNGHMNVDDLFNMLKKKFPSLSLATVYKNINIMIDKLLLSELKVPNKKSVYEINKDEHLHVVCSKCGDIMDVHVDLSQLFDQVKSASNYNLSESSVVFNGVCPKCK